MAGEKVDSYSQHRNRPLRGSWFSVFEFDLALPPKQGVRLVRGMIVWPDGQPAAGVHLRLEDPRWSWQAVPLAAAAPDASGRFEFRCLDGTHYRLHADGAGFSQPILIKPGTGPLDLRVVVTRGRPANLPDMYRSLERWRKGLGLE